MVDMDELVPRALMMITAAGKAGLPLAGLFDRLGDGVDEFVRTWLWTRLVLSGEVQVVDAAGKVLATDDVEELSMAPAGCQIIATEQQQQIYTGMLDRGITLTPAQMILLEAIGRGMGDGASRSDIANDPACKKIPNKEFFRNMKVLISKNLVVKTNLFRGPPRPHKFVPPIAQPQWYLRRYSPLPFPVRSIQGPHVEFAAPIVDAQTRTWIDEHLVSRLLHVMGERPAPHEIAEDDLEQALEEMELGIEEDFDWVVVRERLFASGRVEWTTLQDEDDWTHGLRLVDESCDVAMDSYGAALHRSGDLSTYDMIETPILSQAYTIIDGAGSTGILTTHLFKRLRLIPRRGMKMIKELFNIEGPDGIVQIADRLRTNLTYRLFRRLHLKSGMEDVAVGARKARGKRKVKAESDDESYDEDVEENGGGDEDEEAEEEVNALGADTVTARRARWLRDVIAKRKITTFNYLVHFVRHREMGNYSMVASKSVRNMTVALEAQQACIRRSIYSDDDNEGSPTLIIFSAELDPDDPDVLERAREEILQCDPQVETRPGASNSTFDIGYPILCGFVRWRMLRAKLLHLHIAELVLGSKPHLQHWYLHDIFTAMPLHLFLMIGGAIDEIPPSILFDEWRVSLPISRQTPAVRKAVINSLENGNMLTSLRVQDVIELCSRLGLIGLFMPSSHPATWQITFRSSPALFPDVTFDTAQNVEDFWVMLRAHCKGVYLREGKITLAADQHADPDPEMEAKYPAGRFPEIYVESNWSPGYELSNSRREMIWDADDAHPIETSDALERFSRQNYTLSTGKTAWLLAQKHLRFIRRFLETIDMNDPWHHNPDELRRTKYLEKNPMIMDPKTRRRKRMRVIDADAREAAKSERRAKYLRSSLCRRGQSPEVNPAPELPTSHKVDLRKLSRRSHAPAATVDPPAAVVVNTDIVDRDDGGAVDEPAGRNEWTDALFAAVVETYGLKGYKAEPEQRALIASHPRLNCLLTTMKMILTHPDQIYDASPAMDLLGAFTDADVTWAFHALTDAEIIVKRKHMVGGKLRGHYALSSKSLESQRLSTFPLDLIELVHDLCGKLSDDSAQRVTAETCLAAHTATGFSLAATGAVRIESDDVSVTIQPFNMSFGEYSTALDHPDVRREQADEDMALVSPPAIDLLTLTSDTCVAIEATLKDAGADGCTMVALLTSHPDLDASEMDVALETLIAMHRAVCVDCHSEKRWVHCARWHIWTIDGSVRRSWVLLNGDINTAFVAKLELMIISKICSVPSITEEGIAACCPTLSPRELSFILEGLVRNRKIKCRPLVSAPATTLWESDEPLSLPSSRVKRCYFAEVDCLVV